jgi:hypothetical protein
MSAFITAQSLGTLRSNFTGTIGFKITVGASNLIVGSLGRWVVSGNSQTHQLTIFDLGTSSVIASVTVNCSGATPGQYLYGAITPTTLVAGHSYSIQSAEVSGGDQFYDDNTTVTPDATMGSVPNAIFSNNQANGTTNNSYGPLNFQLNLSTGSLAITEAADTISAAGVAPAAGSFAITEASDLVAAAGVAPVVGSLNKTEGGDTLSAAGSVPAGGALSLTEAPDTIAAAGIAPATGNASLVEEGDFTFVVDLHAFEAGDVLVATANQKVNPGTFRPDGPTGPAGRFRDVSGSAATPGTFRAATDVGTPGKFKPTG